jgi:ankyrin repeat protein
VRACASGPPGQPGARRPRARALPPRAAPAGSTPLHRAASAGKPEAVRLLLEAGKARVDARDRQGNTPLFVAVECREINIAVYLAAKGGERLAPGLGVAAGPGAALPLLHHGWARKGPARRADASSWRAAAKPAGADLEAANKEEQTPLGIAGDMAKSLLAAAGGEIDVD